MDKPQYSRPQDQLGPLYFSLGEIYNQRAKFETPPEFQRKQVWTVRAEQGLIETILSGDPVMPLECFEANDPVDGRMLYKITDGFQRFSAIVGFREGRFKTWTPGQKRMALPNSLPPIEPGKWYEQLTPTARERFDIYRLQLNRISSRSRSEMAARFLSINTQTPLTAAEKLNAFASKARDTARLIEEHEFWKDFYVGRSNRGQVSQSSLQLLAIELSATGILDLQSSVLLKNLASGNRDEEITDKTTDTVINRLDVIVQVFHGMTFTARGASIAMYQAVKFLENTGYEFKTSDRRKLTPWLTALIAKSKRASGVPHYAQPIQLLAREKSQRSFWNEQLPVLKRLFGIDTLDIPA